MMNILLKQYYILVILNDIICCSDYGVILWLFSDEIVLID